MKKFMLAASAAALAFAVTSAANAAPTFTVKLGTTASATPALNDFQSSLPGFETFGASVTVDSAEPVLIMFEYIGSESNYFTKFTFGSQELNDTLWYKEGLFGPGDPDYQVIFAVVPGSTTLAMTFSANDPTSLPATSGDGTTEGDHGFAVFLPNALNSGDLYTGSNVLYFGYDDNGAGPDDNHDDMIIRATVLPVPEPASWALMVAGVAAVGLSMRRRTATTRVAFS